MRLPSVLIGAVLLCIVGCESSDNKPQSNSFKASKQANQSNKRVEASKLTTNKNCISIIKDFEGVRLKAYQDSGGVWLVGYGHAAGVRKGMQISASKAENLLKSDLKSFEQQLTSLLTQPVSSNEFSAMVCLMYNIGQGNFAKSTVLKRVNNKQYTQAADAFLMWNKIKGKVSSNLSQRRQLERLLFKR